MKTFLLMCLGVAVIAGVAFAQTPLSARLLTTKECSQLLAGVPADCQTNINTYANSCNQCGGPDGDGYYWKCNTFFSDQDCINWHNGGVQGWVQTCDRWSPGAVSCGGQKMKYIASDCTNIQMGSWQCGRTYVQVTAGGDYLFAGCP